MPADSGLAFVLVPHLDPSHESMMVDLLGKLTPMLIVEAKQGMAVLPNCIYIIPPNCFLSISQGMLQLSPPPESLSPITTTGSDTIVGNKSIFKIPLDDDTYNTNDEKRYLYGITYYFNGGKP